nr:MAG TPA: hypothetical protein [Caudoviricetes sp.]DAQ27472.1 MAG TPA: hypothetical protein [Caudoviricetes sp.]
MTAGSKASRGLCLKHTAPPQNVGHRLGENVK